MSSVLQDWVMKLPLRHQGTIVAAMRGSDTDPKHSVAKNVVRALRRVVLNPADIRETKKPNAYMYYNAETFLTDVSNFSRSMDNYPLHFVTHLIHAIEIVGYKHPDPLVKAQFFASYHKLVGELHLFCETEEIMDLRLVRDRITEGE